MRSCCISPQTQEEQHEVFVWAGLNQRDFSGYTSIGSQVNWHATACVRIQSVHQEACVGSLHQLFAYYMYSSKMLGFSLERLRKQSFRRNP